MSDEKFDPFLLCGPGDRKKKTREPKADPKEKELKDEIMEILLDSYVEYDSYHEFSGHWEKAKDFDYDKACEKLADHFNSKLKLCLNREL